MLLGLGIHPLTSPDFSVCLGEGQGYCGTEGAGTPSLGATSPPLGPAPKKSQPGRKARGQMNRRSPSVQVAGRGCGQRRPQSRKICSGVPSVQARLESPSSLPDPARVQLPGMSFCTAGFPGSSLECGHGEPADQGKGARPAGWKWEREAQATSQSQCCHLCRGDPWKESLGPVLGGQGGVGAQASGRSLLGPWPRGEMSMLVSGPCCCRFPGLPLSSQGGDLWHPVGSPQPLSRQSQNALRAWGGGVASCSQGLGVEPLMSSGPGREGAGVYALRAQVEGGGRGGETEK